MWLLDWFLSTLQQLQQLFGGGKERRIIFLGLDNAGKSTLTRRLASGRLEQLPPTTDPLVDTIVIGSTTVKTFDLGGHETARLLWRDYAATADGLVFMVDAADRERLPEARAALGGLLAMLGEGEVMAGVPVLVLGNKIDRREAMSPQELEFELGLRVSGPDVRLFMCSVVRSMGYADGFKWLLSSSS